jgi:hypothetical protein
MEMFDTMEIVELEERLEFANCKCGVCGDGNDVPLTVVPDEGGGGGATGTW